MGDAKDAAVVILLVPGALFPLLAVVKLALSRTALGPAGFLPLGRIVVASALDSTAPMLALFASGSLMTLTRGPMPSLLEVRSYRIGLFLTSLFIVSWMANYAALRGQGALGRTRGPWRLRAAGALGVSSAVLFSASWVGLGELLIVLG